MQSKLLQKSNSKNSWSNWWFIYQNRILVTKTVEEKELKKLLIFRRVDAYFSSHQRDQEKFKQENNWIALNILLSVSHNSEEIKLAYKSSYNKHKNQVIFLMIDDEANNYYYFVIKNLSEVNSIGWLQGKKSNN